MKIRTTIAIFLILALLLIPLTAEAKQKKLDKPAKELKVNTKTPFMFLDQIKPGMKGYGKTVFKGTTISTFKITVIGVSKHSMYLGNQADIILVRVESGYPVEHKSGIIGGMSGSPIYIDGKLIGAIGWGHSFMREPIAGVTPIQYMLKELNSTFKTKTSKTVQKYTFKEPVVISGKKYTKLVTAPLKKASQYAKADTLVLSPANTYLMISGLNTRSFKKMAEYFDDYKLIPVPSTGRMKLKDPIKFEPGAALGATLVSGDIEMTGLGTLTYRQGNLVLGFGHPMMGLGNMEYPLTTGYIHGVLPSYARSFKYGSPVQDIGMIYRDGPFAVAGKIGHFPTMIPINITVTNTKRNYSKDYKLKIIKEKTFTPLLTAFSLIDAVDFSADGTKGGVAKISYLLHSNNKKLPVIKHEDYIYATHAIDTAVGKHFIEFMKPMQINNYFGDLNIKEGRIKVEVIRETLIAEVKRVTVKKTTLEPGEPLEMTVELKPYGRPLVKKSFKISIPDDIRGKITIGVSGGMLTDKVGKLLKTKMPDPTTLKQLINWYAEKPKTTDLVVRLALPRAGVDIQGKRFSPLPQPIARVIGSAIVTDTELHWDEIQVKSPTDWILLKGEVLSVKVEKKGLEKSITLEKEEVKPDEPKKDKENKQSVFNYTDKETLISNIRITPFQMAETQKKQDQKKTDQKKKETPVKKLRTLGLRASHDNIKEFKEGSFINTAYTTQNEICLVGEFKELATIYQFFIWSLAVDNDRGIVYGGTGNGGKIIKYAQGKAVVLKSFPTCEIFGLTLDNSGNLYAGVSPKGEIYKIDTAGKVSLFAKVGQPNIYALAFKDGYIYAGTGGEKGIIYKIATSNPQVTAFFTSDQAHITCLVFDGKGYLYAGSTYKSLVYKLNPVGTVENVYDASPEESITSLAKDKNDNIYVGTYPKGIIYRISPDGSFNLFIKTNNPYILSLACDDKNNVYAGSGNEGQIYKFTPDHHNIYIYKLNDNQILSLASDNKGNIYGGTGNKAVLFKFSANYPAQGTFESKAIDAGNIVSVWGNIAWQYRGGTVTMQTRTGNSSEPDSTWSSWSSVYANPKGTKITSPPARFIQYRAILTPLAETPYLSKISVYFQTINRQPRVLLQNPQGGEVWSKKKNVIWIALDPDKDYIIFDLYYSSDKGHTWKVLKKDYLTKGKNHKYGYALNTSSLPDSEYLLKVVVSDRLSRPTNPMSDENISKPFVIDNTPPVISGLTFEITSGRKYLIRGTITDATSLVTAVQYRISKQHTWLPAIPVDGIFDSSTKNFMITTNELTAGDYTIEIRGSDEAGNIGEATVKIKVK